MEELCFAFEGCLRFMPLSEFDEIPRYAGQYFRLIGVHGNVVFDSNPHHPRNVNARFYRDHKSGLQTSRLPPREPRILMNFKSETVARAVREVVVQLVPGKHLSRCGIYVRATGPGSDRCNCLALCFEDGLMPAFHARRSTPHTDCSRNIAAIVREYNTQV